jgi:thiol-disulfide isomerase/thioredoxin
MDKKFFKYDFIIGALLMIGALSFLHFNSDYVENVLSKKIELSDLALENTKGEKINLQTGKPLVLNFWATWCAPCIEEFPEFEEINEKYKDKVEFLMISDEEINLIKNFKYKKGYQLNMVHSSKTFDKYGLQVRPVTYFYSSDGKLKHKTAGSITYEILESEVKKLISK